MTTTKAILAYEPLLPGTPNLKLKEVTLRELKDDELLVRLVATGICHTDIVFAGLPAEYQKYPRVLGHEGGCSSMLPPKAT
jgi:D-arabinose 1-dehydrogenase-like Zn-dependent alcohol dehydrogenase